MKVSETTIKWIAGFGGGIASYLFGGWTPLLGTLALFALFDYATGFMASAKEGKLNSNVGWQGIAKKIGMFVLVAVCHHVDTHLPIALPILEGKTVLRDGAATAFLVNEVLSIMENCRRLGVKIPSILERALDQLKDQTEGDGNDGGQNRN